MSSAATLPDLPDAFTHSGEMLSLHQFLAALTSDPIATAGAFLLIVLVVAYILAIMVFARRSGNDMHDQLLIPVRTNEQREYWITRRRQRFVAVHGGYPDLFGDGTLLGEAAKHRKLRTAEAKLEGSRKHINVIPAKRREPYLPVFAPKLSGDDLFGEMDRLEAQAETSPGPRMKEVASEGHQGAARGPWWKMFEQPKPDPTTPGTRTSRTLRPKSRSSLGTMASLLESTDEDDEEQLKQG
ncbi:hypothetical protein LTR85_008318 [Meristemomyces frigidus]|nr:hypothetical protein LTR85_008318 [Meristemomyces frigidus]